MPDRRLPGHARPEVEPLKHCHLERDPDDESLLFLVSDAGRRIMGQIPVALAIEAAADEGVIFNLSNVPMWEP